MVDPRPSLRLERQLGWLQAGFYWRNAVFQSAVDTRHEDFLGRDTARLPPHQRLMVTAQLVDAVAACPHVGSTPACADSSQTAEVLAGPLLEAALQVQAAQLAAEAVDWTHQRLQVEIRLQPHAAMAQACKELALDHAG